MAKGLFVAIEELIEREEEENAQLPQEEIAAADTLESGIIESNTRATEIEELDEKVERAAGDISALEELAERLEDTLEDGGLDPVAAEIAQEHIKHVYRNLGVEKKVLALLPSMESFGTKDSRIKSTELAIESVQSVIQAGMNYVVTAWEKIREMILNFFDSVLSNGRKLKEKAKALGAKIAALPGNLKAKVFKNEKLAKDGLTSVKTVDDGLIEVIEVFDSIDKINETTERDTNSSEVKKALDGVEDAVVKANSTGNILKSAGFKLTATADGVATYVKSVFGRTVKAEVPEEESTENISMLSVKYEQGAEAKGGDDIAGASKEELKKVLDNVVKLGDAIDKKKTLLERFKANGKKFADFVKSLPGKFKEGAGGAAAKAKAAANWVIAKLRFVGNIIASYSRAAIDAGRKALDYVEAQYRSLTGKGEGEKASTSTAPATV